MSARTPDPWDQIPGEPTRDFALFLEWAALDPPVDAGDWYRSTVRKRSDPPDFPSYGRMYNRWAWESRREAYVARRAKARARRMSLELARQEAACDALEFSAGSMRLANQKLSTWQSAPGTVPDALVARLVQEHRQRQRDSGEIQRQADAPPPPPAVVDLRGLTEDELRVVEAAEALIARASRSKP